MNDYHQSLDAFDEWYQTYFDIEARMTNPAHRLELWAAWCAGIAWVENKEGESPRPGETRPDP